ncbi:MAG: arginine--tRNA ligase [Candidatus Paceibacterota bacterium]|jgi:arginyl-tRNA synthetase
MLKNDIKKIVNEAISSVYTGLDGLVFVVEYPKKKEFGDYATNAAIVVSKRMGKNPMEIANELALKISEIDKEKKVIERTEVAAPGFVNFHVSEKYLIDNLERILKEKERYGSSNIGKNKVVVIDYSAVNIAKPMHVGHLRSTIIGQAIYNIYKNLGYSVVGDNHTGDWGTQFGKLIYAYKYWGDKKKIKEEPVEEMTRLYVRFHKETEINKDLEEFARKETKKLQNLDHENIKIWNFLTRESLKDYNKIYKILGVKFDYVLGESFYNNMLAGIVKECREKKIAVESQGAIIINLEKFGLPPFIIRKSDGAYLYTTTDLATVKYRKEKFKAEKVVYVVANEQALHFRQLFSSLELLGWNKNVVTEHVKFGMVLGENGKKFSTRKGETVRLEDLIKKAIDAARKAVEEKNPKLSMKQKKKIARVVGVGALKYNDLSQNRLTDITFNWEKMLSLEGNSGPYLQYAYARICSLEDKFNNIYKIDRFNPFDKPDFGLLKEISEKDLIRKLVKYPEIIEDAANEYGPHLIALYLYELVSFYNNFYNSVPILKADRKAAKARIALSRSVAIVIRSGLGLLGIDVLERI